MSLVVLAVVVVIRPSRPYAPRSRSRSRSRSPAFFHIFFIFKTQLRFVRLRTSRRREVKEEVISTTAKNNFNFDECIFDAFLLRGFSWIFFYVFFVVRLCVDEIGQKNIHLM